jgi:hypothetical protein
VGFSKDDSINASKEPAMAVQARIGQVNHVCVQNPGTGRMDIFHGDEVRAIELSNAATFARRCRRLRQ